MDKYNETVTIAGIKAVNHFWQKSAARDFAGFIRENDRLKHNFKDLLSQHYATDIFNCEEAKKQYLEPELIPFD